MLCVTCGQEGVFSITSTTVTKVYRKRECNKCRLVQHHIHQALKKVHTVPAEACQCCGNTGKLVLDHCHTLGTFRGWLCQRCNTCIWGTWGYGGGLAPGAWIFGNGAATQPLTPPAVKLNRGGKKIRAIRERAEAARLATLPRIQRPPRDTPTQSECSEIQHGYQEAFDFWLRVQFEDIPEEEYVDTAELFDELPGVSGYFRFLCLHTVTTEEGGYVLRKTY